MGGQRLLGPLLTALVLLLFDFTDAFNIDVKRALVHRNIRDTYFGYTVSIYKNGGDAMLLVGAPKAQTGQTNVRNGGAVFRCSVDQAQCSEIFFDRTSNEKRLNGSVELPIEDKSNQWFGATLQTSKTGDSVLACAPHYKYFFSKFEVIEPVGTCYYATENFENIREFSPCRQEPARHGHHRFGYGMCGFSAAIPNPADERLFIGAPGTFYWQGSLFVQSTEEERDRPNLPDGPEQFDHSLLGYSTATADFDGDGVDDAVVGVPKGQELRGFVALYDHNLRSIRNLTTEHAQRGCYFGASVTTADLDGDGLADIIVGAPFYTEYNGRKEDKAQDIKPKYDIGQVVVFIQGVDHTFSKSVALNGHSEWGRFGLSVAGAGDLNGDGFEDFIVGAPYDGLDGKGAVYVYHGAEDGVREEYTQKIDANQIDGDMKTFGFSVAGGKDVDNNDYPDIAVGAWQSNKAVMFKTKPVVRVTGYVKSNAAKIDLTKKNCETPDFGNVACEKIQFCVSYDGKNAPEDLELNMRVELDAKKRLSPRAFFLSKDFRNDPDIRPVPGGNNPPDAIMHRIRVRRNKEECRFHDFYVADTVRDKLSPIAISVNYTFEESKTGFTRSGTLEPAIDTTLPQSFTDQIEIDRNCGSDNECVPDLEVSAVPDKEKFVVGAIDNTLALDVKLKNTREDAYESQYFITVPQGFEYSGMENIGNLPVTCSPPEGKAKEGDEYTFTCDTGNPLVKDAEVHFKFLISAVKVDPTKEAIIIKMHANSTNEESDDTLLNNELELYVPLEVKAQLSVTGKSSPEQVDYSAQNRTKDPRFDSDVGPIVSHLYQVTNRGPSAIDAATLDIFWPSFTDSGDNLLYLIDDPHVNDKHKITCRVKQAQNINPDSLAITNEHDADFQTLKLLKRLRRNPEEELEEIAATDGAQVRDDLRSAINRVKETGAAVEYKGDLGRATVNCNDMRHCTHIECDIRRLRDDEYVLVEIFSRVWLNTLIDKAYFEADVSSLAIAKVTSLPSMPKGFNPPAVMHAVTTLVNPTDPGEIRRTIPWWLWLLAILAGIAILLLLILCLWKCGFFKRNRPHAEHATLNRGVEPGAEHFVYSDANIGYASSDMYSQDRHGRKL